MGGFYLVKLKFDLFLLGDPESTASWRFRMTTVCFSWGILNQVQDDGQWLLLGDPESSSG
ncbi:MAG TPA: hypothetical protein PKA29_00410 [Candidatus Saccharibacteria bacterium]|nr:hypothetical protein [Candidatus Saccharibacteria bacterium]